jgi:NDP-sugar pyrophosphorylase family protein
MQIVIPMSGFGERFRKAGYSVPKPLVEIDGKPIIAHVIDMFPDETDMVFICNEDHLAEPSYRMREILMRFCPTGKIVAIPSHKLGPVHAVTLAAQWIRRDCPVLVNYCDFTCYWDWSHFKQWATASKCAGAVPAYRGFHPHTLGTTNYAYIREHNGWMLDIQEKQPYTDNRMEEYASSGSYYFSSGQLMLDAFRATVEQDLTVGGEFYVSLAYKALLKAHLPVAIYDLQHFMQWGTPADVAEYRNWSDTFRGLIGPLREQRTGGAVVVPMAGLGQRFAREGYALTKPLIPVSGRPMVLQATDDLPAADHYSFVLRSDMPGFEDVSEALRTRYPNPTIKLVSEVTEGQACTALLGLDAIAGDPSCDVEGPITFGACDYGALYDVSKLKSLLDDDADVIVWAMRGHANAVRHPQMYGWIDTDGQNIFRISVKEPLGSPDTDPVVLGTFTFKRGADFRRCIARMTERDGRINGEFYLDTCVNDALALGLRCKLFEVDSFMSWGTPNDLRTFEYWQSCFHKWAGHPYRLELDGHVPSESCTALDKRYQATLPTLPRAATA